jgi:ATP-binding cassette, subfamily B, bacterial
MRGPATISRKIKNALRIDRAILLVWKASKKWTLLSICLTVVQGFVPLLTLYVIKLIVDTISEAIQSGDAASYYQRVVFLVFAAASIAIFQAAVRAAGSYVAEAQSTVVTDYVYSALHRKSISLDLSYYENPQYYDTLHRAQHDGPYRPTKIVNGLTRILQNGVSLAAMVALLFMFHWAVGVLLFVSTIPGVVAQVVHARRQYEWQKKRTHEERRASYLSNILTIDAFAKEIRLFDLGNFFADSFNSLRNILRREKLTLSWKKNIAEFLAQLFATVIVMGCLLLIALRALQGSITIGDMVMFYQAFQRGIGYLKDLLTSIASLYEDNMFVTHFFEFLDIKNRITDPPLPVAVPHSFLQGITLENVSFSYPGQRGKVLQNISLNIGAGEVVALVGANGAGKSTLVKLLCRLYEPDSGKITMEGVELNDYAVKDLRRHISVVFQDFVRYYMTVRENIRLGDITIPTASGKIEEAAAKANADAFIEKLPHGYDTLLGRWFNGGEEISLGEWQKIVLARSFLRDAPFVILDEPTSSLDIQTEFHLYTKFRQLIAGHSALLISHRFSTVRMADRIYVLRDGKVAESGTHRQLMDLDGIYADMYAKQAAWLE